MPSNPRKHKERARNDWEGRRSAEAAAAAVFLHVEKDSNLEVTNSIDEVAYSSGAGAAHHTATQRWQHLNAVRQSIWSNDMRCEKLHRPMKPSVMSGASTQPASACGDGADAVHLLAPWKQAPPSLEAPPSLKAPPSQEAPLSLEAPPSRQAPPSLPAGDPPGDPPPKHLKMRFLRVHAYLKSARELTDELNHLKATQHFECTTLQHRINEEYQRACELCELSC